MLNVQKKSETDKPETNRNLEKLRVDKQQHETHISESNIAQQKLKNGQNLLKMNPP